MGSLTCTLLPELAFKPVTLQHCNLCKHCEAEIYFSFRGLFKALHSASQHMHLMIALRGRNLFFLSWTFQGFAFSEPASCDSTARQKLNSAELARLSPF